MDLKKSKVYDIENLISKLATEEGKMLAIIKFGFNRTVSDKLIQEAIDFYTANFCDSNAKKSLTHNQQDLLEKLATVAEQRNFIDDAIELYLKADQGYKAADLALQTGDLLKTFNTYKAFSTSTARRFAEEQGLNEEYITLSIEDNCYKAAVEKLLKLKQKERAKTVCLDALKKAKKIKNREFIPNLYDSSSKTLVDLINETDCADEAIAHCEETEKFVYAGAIEECAGYWERALAFYKKADRYDLAVKVAEMMNIEDNALQKIYDTALEQVPSWGIKDKHIALAKTAKRTDKVIEFLEKTRKYEEAAKLAESEGQIDRAISNYRKTKNLHAAASLAAKHGRTEQSIEIYLSKNQFGFAMTVAKKAGLTDKFNEIGANQLKLSILRRDWWAAAGLAEELGKKELAIQYYTTAMEEAEQKADFIDAERFAIEAGLKEQAKVYHDLYKLQEIFKAY